MLVTYEICFLTFQAAGIKETYYGYDEDTKSVDSEHSLSMSSRMSSSRVSLDTTAELDDASDDVFEEVRYWGCTHIDYVLSILQGHYWIRYSYKIYAVLIVGNSHCSNTIFGHNIDIEFCPFEKSLIPR